MALIDADELTASTSANGGSGLMAPGGRETLTGSRGFNSGPREGRISGYLLKVIRESIGFTQDGLAEDLGVDLTTVQGWESGRRPLIAVPTGSFLAIRARLLRLGAQPNLLAQLEPALEADHFLAQVLNTAPAKVPPDEHPLSAWVITRPFTDMTSWAVSGQRPSFLDDVPRRSSRRGPVSSGPRLAVDERAHFFEHLKSAAERANVGTVDGMLLRRQAHYVASFDDSAETAEWLAGMQRQEERRSQRSADWSLSWAVVRSGAHSLARKGDPEALQAFIGQAMKTDRCETANLNYWAYWLGEVTEPQTADTFMVELPTRSWRGTKLLAHLVGKLEPKNVYIDVVAHTVWALLQHRPAIVHDEPGTLGRLQERAARVLDEAAVSVQSRRELEEVLYGLRIADGR
ncbi:helix-turn-helix domain-containing protein [Actinomadura nitritigenes]|uniref:helix-turn-helix domain-containing protein n=1 Tax=Actinomadura nitritigenes TaxID=134602 RepID=UPI003D8FDF12